ncbi:hypothetical protein R1sor_004155 [Riccia sorocarpa]|uniref:Uncharacterized protein n=1 Tax=Riccia sorocarpa TaxID=122646 RepID=A0ABD3H3P8_9MARC
MAASMRAGNLGVRRPAYPAVERRSSLNCRADPANVPVSRPKSDAGVSNGTKLVAFRPLYRVTAVNRLTRTPHSGYHFDGSSSRFFDGIHPCKDSFAWMYSVEDPGSFDRTTGGLEGIGPKFPGVDAQVMGANDCQYDKDGQTFWGSSVIQPYMGDVEIFEEEEPLAEYVPPPQIPVEDVEIRNNVEEVMYTLLECIPGPMNALLHDDKKWGALIRMFSETVQVQDPLICVKGLNSLEKLLKGLCHAGITVNLHDVYYENIAAEKCKRWVYAIWTAQNHEFKLSGESRYEVNKEGKVKSVSSVWYKLRGEDDTQLAALKLWLADLYSRSGL